MTFLDIILLPLAVLRLYYLFAHDNGPFNVLVRFRLLVGVKPYDNVQGYITTTNFAYGLMCPMCMGLWYSMLGVAGYYLVPDLTRLIVTVLACSILAVLILNVQNRLIR